MATRLPLRRSALSATLAAVVWIATAGCSLSEPSREQDQSGAALAALDYVADEYPYGDEPVCFDPLLSGLGLDDWRKTLEDFRSLADEPDQREAVELAFAGKGMGWLNPIAKNGRYGSVTGKLEKSLAEPMARVLSRTHSPLPYKQLVPADRVPMRLIYKPNASLDDPDCSSVISMSGATLDGNVAFVETSYTCGPLCGHGDILALRRTPSGWRVIARAGTWMS